MGDERPLRRDGLVHVAESGTILLDGEPGTHQITLRSR